MRAHNVIIVSSGRTAYAHAGALDELIRSIVALRKQPILVLGPDGDDLLRTCEEIEQCEIVFDPNYDGEFFSSLKAGLFACESPTLVVPLADDHLPPSTWRVLETELRDHEGKSHVLRPITHNDASPQWPALITACGVKALKALPSTSAWEKSESIRTEVVPVSSAAEAPRSAV